MEAMSIEFFAKLLGYLTVIGTTLYGVWKVVFIFYMDVKRRTETLNPVHINHIKDIAYRALMKSETALDFSGAAVYVCRPSGECVYASQPLCLIFEQEFADMLGYGWTLSIPMPYRDIAADNWKKCIEQRRPYQDTYPIQGSKGIVHVWTKADECRDESREDGKGEILFYIGVVKILADEKTMKNEQ